MAHKGKWQAANVVANDRTDVVWNWERFLVNLGQILDLRGSNYVSSWKCVQNRFRSSSDQPETKSECEYYLTQFATEGFHDYDTKSPRRRPAVVLLRTEAAAISML